MMKRFLVALFCLFSFSAGAQNPLACNSLAVDSLLCWLDNGCKPSSISHIVRLPTMQLMEQLIKEMEPSSGSFADALSNYANKRQFDDCYMIKKADESKEAIRALMDRISKTNLYDEAYLRAIRFFPTQYKFSEVYDVFFTPVGWRWGDASTFCYEKSDGHYIFSENGRPAIMFNAAIIANSYGSSVDDQMNNLMNVLAHELFHAMLADYSKANWTDWEHSIANDALALLQNEGVAHYVASRESLIAKYKADTILKKHELSAFSQFADSSAVIFDKSKDDTTRISALNNGTYGKYWNKYLCITGMFMAYHIEQELGEEAIRRSIKDGPLEFIKCYELAVEKNPNLPKLKLI